MCTAYECERRGLLPPVCFHIKTFWLWNHAVSLSKYNFSFFVAFVYALCEACFIPVYIDTCAYISVCCFVCWTVCNVCPNGLTPHFKYFDRKSNKKKKVDEIKNRNNNNNTRRHILNSMMCTVRAYRCEVNKYNIYVSYF